MLVQIALVSLLFLKLESHEDRLDEILRSSVQINHAGPNAKPVTLPSQDNVVDGQPGPDGQQLRRIIREELKAAFGDIEMMAQNATPTKELPDYDEVEMQYQRELLIEEMETLKGQVEVSSLELQRLTSDIAKLNPEARTELLKMLNQALNRGEIKGHL